MRYQEVLQHAFNEPAIRLGDQPIFDLDLDFAVRLDAAQLGDDLSGQGTDVDRLTLEALPRQTGEFQNLVDQRPHPHRAGAHALEIVTAVLAQLLGVVT